MSITLCFPFRKFALLLTLCSLTFVRSTVNAAPSQAVLWTDGVPRGQWLPFGQGMQDSAVLSEGQGLRMIVDWAQTTYGVGARFTADPKTAAAKPLPKLTGFHKIQLEARSESEKRVKLTVELVVQGTNQAVRADKDQARTLTPAWQKLEFTLPNDFPGLSADGLSNVDTIRILFLNPDKSGKDSLEFRNVTLSP